MTEQAAQRHGDFQIIKTFDPPILGLVRGRYVKIWELGNHAGHSLAFRTTNEYGENVLESFGDVKMADPSTLPPTVEQVEQLLVTRTNTPVASR